MEPTPSVEQQFLKKLTDIIDANLHNEQFGVNELATELGMSRITLHRKVKSTIKKSVSEFIREARLNRAYELLQQKTGTVSEIAYKVGFGSVTYFYYSFHKHYGFPPGEVLKGLHPDVEKATVKNKQTLIQKLQKSKILYVIPIVILLAVVVVQFIRNQDNSRIEKTIAVLPIIDENSDENGSIFSYWFGSQIVTNLNKIGDFTVVPYSSAEVYRDSKKENREIAKELMVNYLIRGRTIRTGNQVKINVELIEASSGNSLWSEIYKKEIDENDPNKVFALCDSVVFSVVKKMNNKITPEEKVQITKKTTENIAALSFYQQGIRHFDLSTMMDLNNWPEFHKEVQKAIQCFKQAIELDSTFSDAYRFLGEIYNQRLYYQADMYLADRYLDTCKTMIEKALYFDEDNIDAKKLKYFYFVNKGLYADAEKLKPIFEKSIKNYKYFEDKCTYFWQMKDYSNYIESFYNYQNLKPTDISIPPWMIYAMRESYTELGFVELSKKYNDLMFISTNDTLLWLFGKFIIEAKNCTVDTTLNMIREIRKKYPSPFGILYNGLLHHLFAGEYAKALDSIQILEAKILISADSVTPDFVYGYTYLKNGMMEKADYHFKGGIKRHEEEIKLSYFPAKTYYAHFALAAIYSILDDRQKSLNYLRMMKESKCLPRYYLIALNERFMFENVRQEPEFKPIVKELEEIYNKEHERIKKLLISNGWEEL